MNRWMRLIAGLSFLMHIVGFRSLEGQGNTIAIGSCADVLYLAGRNVLNEQTRSFYDRASQTHNLTVTERDKQLLSEMSGGGSYAGIGAQFSQAKEQVESYRNLREAAASNREISDEERMRMQNFVDPAAIAAWNRCIELQSNRATMSVDAQDERHIVVSVGDQPGGGRVLNGVLVQPERAFTCRMRQAGGPGASNDWVVADRTTFQPLQGRLFTIECQRQTNEAATITLPSNPGVLISLPFPAIPSISEQERNAAVGALLNLVNGQAQLLRDTPVDQVFSYPNSGGTATDNLISPEDNRAIRIEVRGFTNGTQAQTLTVTWNSITQVFRPGGACAYSAPSGRRYRLVLKEIDNRSKWALLQLFRVYAATPATGVNCSDDGNVV